MPKSTPSVNGISLSEKELALFRLAGDAAAEMDAECYLIGGFVRDRILGRPTSDADIVCTGDGIAVARRVAARLGPGVHVDIFKNFGTAHIRTERMDLEFVGARKESYRLDSRKPEVMSGTLQEDRDRRDFTINALSVSLNAGD